MLWGLPAAVTNAGATIKGYSERKTPPAWDLRLGFSQRFLHAPFRIHATAYGLNPVILRSSLSTSQKFMTRLVRHFTLGAPDGVLPVHKGDTPSHLHNKYR